MQPAAAFRTPTLELGSDSILIISTWTPPSAPCGAPGLSPSGALARSTAVERTWTPEHQVPRTSEAPGCVRTMKIESDPIYRFVSE